MTRLKMCMVFLIVLLLVIIPAISVSADSSGYSNAPYWFDLSSNNPHEYRYKTVYPQLNISLNNAIWGPEKMFTFLSGERVVGTAQSTFDIFHSLFNENGELGWDSYYYACWAGLTDCLDYDRLLISNSSWGEYAYSHEYLFVVVADNPISLLRESNGTMAGYYRVVIPRETTNVLAYVFYRRIGASNSTVVPLSITYKPSGDFSQNTTGDLWNNNIGVFRSTSNLSSSTLGINATTSNYNNVSFIGWTVPDQSCNNYSFFGAIGQLFLTRGGSVTAYSDSTGNPSSNEGVIVPAAHFNSTDGSLVTSDGMQSGYAGQFGVSTVQLRHIAAKYNGYLQFIDGIINDQGVIAPNPLQFTWEGNTYDLIDPHLFDSQLWLIRMVLTALWGIAVLMACVKLVMRLFGVIKPTNVFPGAGDGGEQIYVNGELDAVEYDGMG